MVNTAALSPLACCRARSGSGGGGWSGSGRRRGSGSLRPSGGGGSRGRSSRLGLRAAVAGAGEDLGTGDGVLDVGGVEVELDTGVGTLVSTREGNSAGREGAATSGDAELSALHVELSTGVVASGVKSNELATEEVVTRRNAGRNGDCHLAVVGNELVHGPDAVVVAILVDLEPAVGRNGAERIGNLCKVGEDGTLVGSIWGIVRRSLLWIYRGFPTNGVGLGRSESVAPEHGDLVTGLDLLDVGGEELEGVGTTVASHGRVGDILDGTIVLRKTHVVVAFLHHSVDTNGLEDGVRIGADGKRHKGDERLNLHCYSVGISCE